METILILHGWGSCAKNWQRVKEGLENGGYKVYLPDLPGFGESSPLSRAWSIDDYVEWLRDFCEKSNLSQFFLLGHSFGGGLAAKFSSRFPEKVKKLILVDAAIIRVVNAKRELLAKIAKLIKVFSFLPFYDLIRKVFYKFIASDYPGLEGAMRETYLNVVKKDLSDCLPAISTPTLIVWGEKDKRTTLRDAQTIKEKISVAKLEIISNVKHSPHLEAPEILVKKALNYIKL